MDTTVLKKVAMRRPKDRPRAGRWSAGMGAAQRLDVSTDSKRYFLSSAHKSQRVVVQMATCVKGLVTAFLHPDLPTHTDARQTILYVLRH